MNGVKPFYKSTGVIGCSTGAAGALASLIAALAALKGLEIGLESQALIVTLFVAFGGSVAGLIGRIKADLSIGKAPGCACGGVIKSADRIVGEAAHEVMAFGSSPPVERITSQILQTSGPGLADVLDKLAEAVAALNAQRVTPETTWRTPVTVGPPPTPASSEPPDGQSGQPTIQPSNP